MALPAGSSEIGDLQELLVNSVWIHIVPLWVLRQCFIFVGTSFWPLFLSLSIIARCYSVSIAWEYGSMVIPSYSCTQRVSYLTHIVVLVTWFSQWVGVVVNAPVFDFQRPIHDVYDLYYRIFQLLRDNFKLKSSSSSFVWCFNTYPSNSGVLPVMPVQFPSFRPARGFSKYCLSCMALLRVGLYSAEELRMHTIVVKPRSLIHGALCGRWFLNNGRPLCKGPRIWFRAIVGVVSHLYCSSRQDSSF